MSEEEQEAIKYLKGRFELFEEDDVLAKWDYEAINNMLALIDKQQKEIEELNIENINLKRNQIIDKSSIPNQENFYDCYNYISKDKIRGLLECIEGYLEGCYMCETEYNVIQQIKAYENIKGMVEKLLKEE